MSVVGDFLSKVQAVYKTGVATEHSYRSAIETLFSAIDGNITALNEPKRVACGAPDFIIQRGEIIIGHVEAKDLDVNLHGMKDANKDQQARYRKALPNLIYTNCLVWVFFREGELIASVTIADLGENIEFKASQFDALEHLLRDFVSQHPQTITSPKTLAKMMAGKAMLIRDVLRNALVADTDLRTELSAQYSAFREHLIHDITPEDFADIYAETIAYGLFAARLHDESVDTFSRREALDLLPKSNPFLRSLFSYIAGPDLDDRIKWIVDDLAQVFQAADIHKLMDGFGKLTGQHDPFLHFYETFLAAYNPAKRKARGVWYTPEAVVNFITRAVDEVLQTEFGISDGLADTSKITIDWDTGQANKKGKPITIRKEVHRVQILDPATGTGTFLAEVIKQIAPKVKGIAEGMWSAYIERDLIPRLHGFELLMASYAMCHMKLEMILTALGYKPSGTPPRLSVYLTNSLEEGEPANQTLPFAQWLSNEVKQANTVKRDMPIMCVIGNPPYSVSSTNKSPWITRLIAPYKQDLDETSLNALSDDYVKFLRLAEYFIQRNGNGVVGMVTNNSFLDGVVHRKMRLHFRETFDAIYVVNLHGDANKKEKSPDGSPDKNVFDIKQGVSILIAVKRGSSRSLARVWHADFYGTRESKYNRLLQSGLSTVAFTQLPESNDYHFFSNKSFSNKDAYESGFQITEIFKDGKSGVKFRKDKLLITSNFTRSDAQTMVHDVQKLDAPSLLKKYKFKETPDWKVETQRPNFMGNVEDSIIEVAYRPLDFRFTFYPLDKINRIIPRGDSRHGLMRNMILGSNIALVVGRQNKSGLINHFLAVDKISEMKTGESTIQSYHFPLYLYPSEEELDRERRVNFDDKIFRRIQRMAEDSSRGKPDEVAVFDYIYGVLHCPAYRETFAEFLKIDFPRIPWPASIAEFWDVSDKGKSLRRLHLMEPQTVGEASFPFKGQGDAMVDLPRYQDGKVWINETQYFDAVPEVSWSFYIGGYQPAQKWLKDRKGIAISFEDVKHYQRVLKVLSETARIMKTITMTLDAVEQEDAGVSVDA